MSISTEKLNWLNAELERFRKITNEKIAEFDHGIADSRQWLDTYLNQFLTDSPKKMRDLMKTPAKSGKRVELAQANALPKLSFALNAASSAIPSILSLSQAGSGNQIQSGRVEKPVPIRESETASQIAEKQQPLKPEQDVSSFVEQVRTRMASYSNASEFARKLQSQSLVPVVEEAPVLKIEEPEREILPFTEALNNAESILQESLPSIMVDSVEDPLMELEPKQVETIPEPQPIKTQPTVLVQEKAKPTVQQQETIQPQESKEKIASKLPTFKEKPSFSFNSTTTLTKPASKPLAQPVQKQKIAPKPVIGLKQQPVDADKKRKIETLGLNKKPALNTDTNPEKKIKQLGDEKTTTRVDVQIPTKPTAQPIKVPATTLKQQQATQSSTKPANINPLPPPKPLESQPQSSMEQITANQPNGSTSIVKQNQDGDISIPEVPSDDDYDSGRSDDEDDNADSFNIPLWARPNTLVERLRSQRSINPDTIFSRIDTLDLEDVFKGSNMKRFRARTSSANWTRDKLTEMEAIRYDRYMGWTANNNQNSAL